MEWNGPTTEPSCGEHAAAQQAKQRRVHERVDQVLIDAIKSARTSSFTPGINVHLLWTCTCDWISEDAGWTGLVIMQGHSNMTCDVTLGWGARFTRTFCQKLLPRWFHQRNPANNKLPLTEPSKATITSITESTETALKGSVRRVVFLMCLRETKLSSQLDVSANPRVYTALVLTFYMLQQLMASQILGRQQSHAVFFLLMVQTSSSSHREKPANW